MRTLSLVLLCCVTLLFFNCKKPKKTTDDLTILTENFIGSVWRCTNGAGVDEENAYNELRFVTATRVEGWVFIREEERLEMFFEATYTRENKTLTITAEGESFTATLNDKNELITNIDDSGECAYVKQ